MTVYRVARHRYREDLSGKGAYRFGSRWNNAGTFALYASENLSLSVLEIIAQARRPYIAEEAAFVLSLKLPEDFGLEEFSVGQLAGNWRNPARDPGTQLLGDARFSAGAIGGPRRRERVREREHGHPVRERAEQNEQAAQGEHGGQAGAIRRGLARTAPRQIRGRLLNVRSMRDSVR